MSKLHALGDDPVELTTLCGRGGRELWTRELPNNRQHIKGLLSAGNYLYRIAVPGMAITCAACIEAATEAGKHRRGAYLPRAAD